ncbi:putative glycosyl hydrolase [Trypanosoma theileri]|uniref:Putative glycosyl hydrolase n=1 Tax=Trypanosoma theileri TaxID=67003 RepID=A0A1X0P446_9TRYP|nr:putative glycosyl hydrolase [Trypanosoma theileri]ORC91339.1 putative glycosyl hydrolase [Trypanosoma theileri]
MPSEVHRRGSTRSSANLIARRLLCEPWELVETNIPQGADIPISESLFSVGNGHVRVRGYKEEAEVAAPYGGGNRTLNNSNCGISVSTSCFGVGGCGGGSSSSLNSTNDMNSNCRPQYMLKAGRTTLAAEAQPPEKSLRGTYVNGTYEERLLNRHHRDFTVGTCARECFLISVPDAFCIDVFVGSEHVSPATGTVISHTRILDFRTGELRRRFVWLSANQVREVTIESSRFVSATRKGIAVMKYTVSAKNVLNTDIRIVSRTTVPTDARQHLKVENVVARHSLHDASSAVCVRTRNSCKRLVVAVTEVCASTHVEHKPGSNSAFTAASGTSLAEGATPTSLAQTDISQPPNNRFGSTPPTSQQQIQTQQHPPLPQQQQQQQQQLQPQTLPLQQQQQQSQQSQQSQQQQQPQPPQPQSQQPQSQQQPSQQQQQSFTFLAPKCAETENGSETIYTSVISDHTRFELNKFVAFLSDEDAAPEDICDLAILQAREAATLDYDALFQEQRLSISKFWEVADIRVACDNPAVQGALRFNILQLYMTAGRICLQKSPSRGIMCELYGGLQQWDLDAIVIPFFSNIQPETARALLQFRIDTLPQARNIAMDMDIPRGAIYPLRTVNGGENSPASFCAAFLHVNAIIAYSMKRYIIATNDTSILLQGGADVIFSTVLIWLIWGTWDKGQFHIRSVGGPDDYSGLSDNNFFTNIMAQYHMQWVVGLAAFLKEKHPVEWEELKERCQFTDEDLQMIEQAAAKMVIFFDAKNRVHPVDQFFMRKKKWDLGDLKSKRGLLIRTFDPSVIYRHQVCRTPDVVLASMLLPERCTKDEVRANYNFYEPITTNDSSISSVIFSVVASQLDMLDKAKIHFNRVPFVDIENVIGNTGRGLHSSAAAGSWWCLAAGFGGMRLVQGVLHFNPVLPDGCDEYEFFVRHRGCLILVHVTRRTVTYKMVENKWDLPELLIIHSDTNRIHLENGIPESVRLYRDVRVFDFDCVIFDMDSLIDNIEEYHYEAWKKTLESFLHEMGQTSFNLTSELYLAYLKHGKPFPALLQFLGKQGFSNVPLGGPDNTREHNTLYGLFQRKLHYFRHCVRSRGVQPREGALELLSELRQSGIYVGCVTLSKNGHWLLNETPQLMSLIDKCLDGIDAEEKALRWRPEMDYFFAMCEQLNTSMSRTVIVLDSIDGFSKSALDQFKLIVDLQKDPEENAFGIQRMYVSSLKELTVTLLGEMTSRDAVSSHNQQQQQQQQHQHTHTHTGDHTSLVSGNKIRGGGGVENSSLVT